MDSTEKVIERKNEEKEEIEEKQLRRWCAKDYHLGKSETIVQATRLYEFIIGNGLKF
jgi:hypothetical protein